MRHRPPWLVAANHQASPSAVCTLAEKSTWQLIWLAYLANHLGHFTYQSGELMALTSTYSFTERKRIRKSFGNRESVLAVPYLLQIDRKSVV